MDDQAFQPASLPANNNNISPPVSPQAVPAPLAEESQTEPMLKNLDMEVPLIKDRPQETSESVKAEPIKIDPVGVKVSPQKPGRKIRGVFKLALLTILPIALAVGGALTASQYIYENTYREQKGVLLAVSMENTNWQDLGTVFEPLIDLSIKTANGHQTNRFLLDSGAVISSLPREWAEKTGQDLAFLQRSTFKGFGGKTSFAYNGEMMVLLGEDDVSLPVVFTEAANTKSLLGRKGFFENYSVYFNHNEKRIEIRE